MNNSLKNRYKIISIILVVCFASLSLVVTFNMIQAERLALVTKIAVISFIWGFILYLTFKLIEYYRKVDNALTDKQ